MERRQGSQFFFSILSALIVGVGIAYGGIFIYQRGPDTLSSTVSLAKEFLAQELPIEAGEKEGDNDPTFVSRFSRVMSYAAEVQAMDDPTGESLLAAASKGVSAKSYSVMSLDKGNVLAAQDADRLLPMASITKLATAAVARKLFKENDTVEITAKVLATEGNTASFRRGEKYKVSEIMYPLLMVSSNDAAEALSQAYDEEHGRGAFVKEMNEWANNIGAYRTYFADPSGLSSKNVSTAQDISIIARWIKEHDPEIFEITLVKSKSVRTHTWINPTRFLNLAAYVGGKNGYTTEANLTNVSLFSVGTPKRLYSVVLLGSKQRDTDTLAVLNEALN